MINLDSALEARTTTSRDSASLPTRNNDNALTHLLRTPSVCVEINIARDDTYQILFDLGERGGKRIVDTNLTSYTYIERNKMGI